MSPANPGGTRAVQDDLGGQQAVLLREGRADAALLRLPHDDPEGFAYEELLTEPDVAVLPAPTAWPPGRH